LFGSLLKGSQRFDILNISSLISLFAYMALVASLLTQFSSLPVLATIALATTILRLALPLIYVRREIPTLSLSRSFVRRSVVRELLSYSRFSFMTHVAGKVVYSADVILIGMIMGAKPVALYFVASRLFAFAGSAAMIGVEVLLPIQSELEGRAEHTRQRAVLATGIRSSMCVSVLLCFPLVFLPHWVIGAWLGDGFETSVVPLALLGVALLFTQPSAVITQFLFARGRPEGLVVAQASLAGLNLALTTLLLLAVREIWVAALATLLVEGLGAVVVMPLLARRRDVSRRLLAGAWLTPLAAGAAAAVPTLLLARLVTHTTSLAALAAVGLAWTLAFAALAWRWSLSDEERRLVRRLASLRRPPVAAGEDVTGADATG
jgi:O-antigen/teichoic acid export membrane protein